ncbi:putative nuclease HARBI1 isoform X1 [Arapaima gigas]
MRAAALWFAVQQELEAEYDHSTSTGGGALDRLDDDFIFHTSHLSRTAVQFVADCVRGTVEPPADAAVLAALCFFAHGSVRADAAEALRVSPEGARRAVAAVTAALARRLEHFVTFPGSLSDRALVAQEMHRHFGVPNIVGALGCLHAPVAPPAGEEPLYMNGSGFHALACQMVCDAQGNLLSVEEPRPGGVAEQSVWEASRLCAQFAGGRHGHSWLAGAGCYRLSRHVLTPLSCVRSHPGLRYNEAHFKVQGALQRTFGALKLRFQCLRHLGPVDESAAPPPADVIKACCVLHNVARKFSVPLLGELVPEAAHHGATRGEQDVDRNLVLFREEMIRAFFTA